MGQVSSARYTDVQSLVTLMRAHARRRARRAAPSRRALPVMLIPGLMAGDWTMSHLAEVLEREGHRTVRARIGINVGCTRDLLDTLERRLEEAAGRYRSRVALIGWSRGGCLAKLLAMRRPDLVAGLITLASPSVDPRAVSPQVHRQLRFLTWLNAAGARGVLGSDCLSGECAAAIVDELARPFPPGVPFAAYYSKRDSVVDWRACCDPAAELTEVDDSHLSIATDPVVIAGIVRRLRPIAA